MSRPAPRHDGVSEGSDRGGGDAPKALEIIRLGLGNYSSQARGAASTGLLAAQTDGFQIGTCWSRVSSRTDFVAKDRVSSTSLTV